jgi:hypothetical protein
MLQVFKTNEVSSSVGVQQRIMLKKEEYFGSSICFIEVSKI